MPSNEQMYSKLNESGCAVIIAEQEVRRNCVTMSSEFVCTHGRSVSVMHQESITLKQRSVQLHTCVRISK